MVRATIQLGVITMWKILKDTVNEFLEDNCLRMAAALAYYAIFSLPPLLVLVISAIGISGFVTEEAVANRLGDEIRSVVGENGVTQVRTMIRETSVSGNGLWGTIIGAVVLLFGATGVMAQLQDALNEAWDVAPEDQSAGVLGFVIKRLVSLGMILLFALLLLISMTASVVFKGLGSQIDEILPGPLSGNTLEIINTLVMLGVVTTMFAMMYRFLPDRDVAWRHVWLGAGITGVLFVVAKWGLGIYLSHSGVASTYGAAGALALILLWVYYSATIFLLAAEFTQVWARRHQSDSSAPSDNLDSSPTSQPNTSPGTYDPPALARSR
ncbi:MAG: YihY/virulence factor BrkB family protein [Planctomycetaceae bacterium]